MHKVHSPITPVVLTGWEQNIVCFTILVSKDVIIGIAFVIISASMSVHLSLTDRQTDVQTDGEKAYRQTQTQTGIGTEGGETEKERVRENERDRKSLTNRQTGKQ